MRDPITTLLVNQDLQRQQRYLICISGVSPYPARISAAQRGATEWQKPARDVPRMVGTADVYS